jgi:hypothetical protein
MKTKELTLASGLHDPALEKLILAKDSELKELAQKNARHLASRNLPAKDENDLSPYTNDLRSGYSALGAEMLAKLQPETHFPEAKMDADYLREKDRQIADEIKRKDDLNRNALFELGSFNPKGLLSRIRFAVFMTAIIGLGEILFNTKAFEITGENLLFAFLLSVSISVAVFAFAHFMSFKYKEAETKLKRRRVAIFTLIAATLLFTSLAVFRSRYLATHDIHVNPVYFVIINLFFFLVSALLSIYTLPTWAEIKGNFARIKLFQSIEHRNKEIELLKTEKESIKVLVLENTKHRLRISFYANYSAERIRKMYHEALATFKSTNLIFRTDKCVPECYSHPVIEPEIQNHSINYLNTSDK